MSTSRTTNTPTMAMVTQHREGQPPAGDALTYSPRRSPVSRTHRVIGDGNPSVVDAPEPAPGAAAGAPTDAGAVASGARASQAARRQKGIGD